MPTRGQTTLRFILTSTTRNIAMTIIYAQVETAFLMSVMKPVIFLIILFLWAAMASRLDKDAEFFYLKRNIWNMIHMVAAIIGFGLMLIVPIFFAGLVLGLIVLAGDLISYSYYRNAKVPKKAKWELSWNTLTQQIENIKKAHIQHSAKVKLLTADERVLDVPSGNDPNAEAHEALADALCFAMPRDAEKIDLLVDANKGSLVVTIDGISYPQEAIESRVALQLLDYLKSATGMDVSERRKKQAGELKIEVDGFGRHTLELETAGSSRGISMAMTIDPAQRVNIPLEKLGLLDSQFQSIQELLNSLTGVVLIASPSRHGNTTTLYSFLQKHDPYTSSVMTLEDEILFEAEGVSHHRVSEGAAPQQYNDQLAQIIRSDPNVLMLSHLADAETARIVARSTKEIRFYLPLQMPDTFSSVKLWMKLVGEGRLATESLRAVIAQRLARKLCPTCRTGYTPDPAALKKLNLPSKVTQLYHATGQVMSGNKQRECPVCHGIAYRQRIGIFEVMLIDPQARAFIAAGDYNRLRGYLRKNRMLMMQEAGLARVVEGTTDIKEITRVLGEKVTDRTAVTV